jgi:cytochrome c
MNRLLITVAMLCVSSLSYAGGTDSRVATILKLNSDEAYGEYLASECSTCHNTSSADNGIPMIHGQDQQALIEALLAYQDKKRDNETMQSVAGALGNDEIGALALYFSSQQ